MQLISTNQKNTRKLSFAKAWIENQEQIQTKNEEIDETKRKDSHNNETNWKIYL